jgi:hypothetical protein
MMPMPVVLHAPLAALLLLASILPVGAAADEEPFVTWSVHNDTSPPLRELAGPPAPEGPGPAVEINPVGVLPKSLDAAGGSSIGPSEVAQGEPSPDPDVTFQGISATGFIPPDTNGDIGPSHYVQVVNAKYAVYSRTGTLLLGPSNFNTIFTGFGGECQTNNDGDPILLYDNDADRWLISQFAFPGSLPGNSEFHQCIAVSATGDPTGSWHRYDFFWSFTTLNDYPHFGVWPDAYYLAVNQFNETDFAWRGQGVAAFERDRMLQGLSAQMVMFDLFAHNPNFGGQQPADWDGPFPFADGVTPPGLFAEWDDSTWIGPVDAVRLWEFDVDWTTPANSTFGIGLDPNNTVQTADVDPTVFNVPQPVPGIDLDAIADRLMNRMAYRDFGTHESIVTNHTVDANGANRAGIHWLEIRSPFADGPEGAATVYQQGVWSPDSTHRWMGSIAQDGAGNIALGYSASSTSVMPAIRYAVRTSGDALGTLRSEAEAFASTGVQTGIDRWGDYSSMNIDPSDNAFWYTTEFYLSNGTSWRTGIASFTVNGIFADGFESGDTTAWDVTTN